MNRHIEEIAEKSHIAWAIQTDVNRDNIDRIIADTLINLRDK